MGGKQRKKQLGNTGEAPTHEEYGNKKGLTGKKRKNKKEKTDFRNMLGSQTLVRKNGTPSLWKSLD